MTSIGCWPGRAKESFRLVAENLSSAGARRQDFRARREGLVVAAPRQRGGSDSAPGTCHSQALRDRIFKRALKDGLWPPV